MSLLTPLENRRINPLWGIAIVAGTPLIILCVGILSLQASFQWGATTVGKDGEIVYANHIQLKGWEAVPFQAIAMLVGTGGTAFAAYKASSKKNPDPPVPPTEP